MHRRYAHLATCLLVLLAAIACSSPRIDTSSDEKMAASIERVRSSLTPERRAKFDEAIATVGMSNIDFGKAMADAMAGKAPSAERMLGDTKAALNGKTADEIIAAADAIIAQRKAKEKAE